MWFPSLSVPRPGPASPPAAPACQELPCRPPPGSPRPHYRAQPPDCSASPMDGSLVCGDVHLRLQPRAECLACLLEPSWRQLRFLACRRPGPELARAHHPVCAWRPPAPSAGKFMTRSFAHRIVRSTPLPATKSRFSLIITEKTVAMRVGFGLASIVAKRAGSSLIHKSDLFAKDSSTEKAYAGVRHDHSVGMRNRTSNGLAGTLAVIASMPIRRFTSHDIKCGATMLMNSRDVITLVFFQDLGKCRRLPVTR